MSTAQTFQIDSTDFEDTLALAAKIGSRLRGGEVIVLASDVGGGKTSFVRGLAKGMGSNDAVRSPSFTISNQYTAGQLCLYHFDFYRLTDPGIMRDELAEILDDPQAVVAIEWADIVEEVVPQHSIKITVQVTDETARKFTFEYPTDYTYLFTNT